MPKSVLIIDDDPGVLQVLTRHLQKAGWHPYTAATGEDGLQLYAVHAPEVVLLDLNLPTIAGEVVLEILVAHGASVVMLTGVADVDVAVQAMQAGADGFLTKPINFPDLDAAIHRAASNTELRRVSEDLARGTRPVQAFGASPRMQELERHIDLLAGADTTALLLGASGTGKSFIAETIHRRSRRARKPFVEVNCAGLHPTFLDSELFGHERGAFTDAKEMRRGLFELADGGTLFLDEVGDMALELQPKLLKVLETSDFRRLGGTRQIQVDVRLIAATNRDLDADVRAGRFRKDLYYRLSVFPLQVPRLRERTRADILELVHRFLAEMGPRHSRSPTKVSAKALTLLGNHSWPGNVRELRNVLERALVLAAGAPQIEPQHLPAAMNTPARRRDQARDVEILTLEEMERGHIERTLLQVGGNRSTAAGKLGISRSTLHAKLNRYGIASTGP